MVDNEGLSTNQIIFGNEDIFYNQSSNLYYM